MALFVVPPPIHASDACCRYHHTKVRHAVSTKLYTMQGRLCLSLLQRTCYACVTPSPTLGSDLGAQAFPPATPLYQAFMPIQRYLSSGSTMLAWSLIDTSLAVVATFGSEHRRRQWQCLQASLRVERRETTAHQYRAQIVHSKRKALAIQFFGFKSHAELHKRLASKRHAVAIRRACRASSPVTAPFN